MYKFYIPLFFLPSLAFCQTDSLYTMPLNVARAIEADLRKLDAFQKLDSIQEQEIAILSRQVLNRDSVIRFKEMEKRALFGLCDQRIDSVNLLFKAERKRRRTAGIWRDVFIITTGAALYLAITSQ